MITSDGNTIFRTASISEFSTPDIYCIPTWNPAAEVFSVAIAIVKAGGAFGTDNEGEAYFSITKAEVDAKTGTGTGDTAKWNNAVQQVIVDYLDALNPTVTFTIV